MTRYLLDSNIISNAAKPEPSPLLAVWMAEQFDDELFISAWTVAEIWRGILGLPESRKRQNLTDWFSGPKGVLAAFAGRTLDFDVSAAQAWARLMVEGKQAGRPRSVSDMIVAAIAEANGCVVVTDNERDFVGIEICNPMRG